ncbi:T9SS type A sorting domain-containing protein [Rufibacter soli]
MMKLIPNLALPIFSRILFFIGFIILLQPLEGFSQISMTPKTTYTQDFNGLPPLPQFSFGVNPQNGQDVFISNSIRWVDNVFIDNWYAGMTSTSDLMYSSSSKGAIKHTDDKMYTPGRGMLGMGTQSDFALGSLSAQANANTVTGDIYYGLKFKNTSTEPIKFLDINFYLEQWLDANEDNGLLLQYRVASAPNTSIGSIKEGTWTNIGGTTLLSPPQNKVQNSKNEDLTPLDGNLAINRRLIGITLGGAGTPELTILPGYEFMIRWVNKDNGRNAETKDILAIDDLVINGFDPAAVPLPVTLTSFTSKNRDGKVELAWTTASEKDNDYFQVERSTDGKAFHAIGRVKGNGTSSIQRNYAFTDNSALSGTSYYRLKQVDFDGKSELSKVIANTLGKLNAAATLQVGPNPFQQQLAFTLKTATETEAVVELRNMQGKVYYQGIKTITPDASQVGINTSSLPQGIYILSVSGSDFLLSQRVLKVE